MTKEATSTERALKLALEALELNDAPLNNETVVLWEQKIDEAIIALREALTSVPDWASEAIEQPAQHPNQAGENNGRHDQIRCGLHGNLDMDRMPVCPVFSEKPFSVKIHCKEKAKPGGCQLHNLQCGWPKCNELEQPAQQEPVAVVSGYYGGQCVILPIDPARIFNSNTALYTSPPTLSLAQRTWVGLTHEDWYEIRNAPDRFNQGVEWAQAKLKEKNSD